MVYQIRLFDFVNSVISFYNYSGCIDPFLLLTPILINITILPCPLGFKPSTGDLPTCQCTDTL